MACKIVVCQRVGAGIGSVITYANKQLEQTYSELMILLADHPDVSGPDTNALLATFQVEGVDIACRKYADTPIPWVCLLYLNKPRLIG